MPLIVEKTKEIQKFYEEELNWKLDRETYILFDSPRNHFPNALTGIFPFYFLLLFNGGVHSFELLGGSLNLSSWTDLLLGHEMAHIYQLSPKPDFMSFLFKSKIVIKSYKDDAFGIPFFPNLFTSRFMLEGNATYNESRMHLGGRLFSPQNRTLFLSLVKDNQIRSERMTTDHYFFPGGSEKYIVGAYFNEFLNSQYTNPNSFFLNRAKKWYFFFLKNPSFKKTFGKGFHELILEFNNFYSKIADQQQKILTLPKFSESFLHSGLNKSKDKIFFLTNKDLRSKNKLNVYSIKNKSFVSEKTDLPGGKLFLLEDGQFYSRTTQKIDWANIQFGLFDKNNRLNKKYLGKYVFDRKKGKTLSTLVDENIFDIKLYLNDQTVGLAYTSPLLDELGNIYDFKQEGEKSLLIKNQKILLSLNTYFPKLVDVSSNGEKIFFIGATLNGSSLFMINFKKNKKKIYRLSPYDSLIDAKHIQGNQFFVTQVTSKNYSYHIINTTEFKREEKPHQVRYSFTHLKRSKIKKTPVLALNQKSNKKNKEKTNLNLKTEKKVKTLSQSKNSGKNKNQKALKTKDLEPIYHYNEFKFMKYREIVFAPFYVDKNRSSIFLSLLFSDPLLYSNINASMEFVEKLTEESSRTPKETGNTNQTKENVKDFDIHFSYNKYRLKMNFGFNLSKTSPYEDKLSLQKERLYLSGNYPFFYKENWSISGNMRLANEVWRAKSSPAVYRRKDFIEDSIRTATIRQFSVRNQLILNYNENFSLSFRPYKSFSLTYSNMFLTDKKNKSGFLHGLDQISSFDLGAENFIHSSSGYVHIQSDYSINYKRLIKNRLFYFLSNHSFTRLKTHFFWGTLKYEKVINLSWYNRFFFLGLNRFAPHLMGYGHMELASYDNIKKIKIKKKSSLGYSVGMTFDLIAFGKFPFHLIMFTEKNFKKVGWTLGLKL